MVWMGIDPLADRAYLVDTLGELGFRGPAVLEIRPPPERAHQLSIEAAVEARQLFEGFL